MMEVQAAGYTRESLFLCIYYFILINSIHLSFILFDHLFNSNDSDEFAG